MSERYRSPTPGFIEQTCIITGIELPEVRRRSDGKVEARLADHAWLVVLTQDCDLQFDRLARANQPLREGGSPIKKDKLLRSIVLCPGFSPDAVLAGTYLPEAKKWGGKQKDILLGNHDDRYHVLFAEPPLLLEAIVLDFKLTLAVHPEYLYSEIEAHPEMVIAVLNAPFRDRLVQRYANYFSRIAEPEDWGIAMPELRKVKPQVAQRPDGRWVASAIVFWEDYGAVVSCALSWEHAETFTNPEEATKYALVQGKLWLDKAHPEK